MKQNLLLSFVSILVTLLVLEFAARQIYSDPWYAGLSEGGPSSEAGQSATTSALLEYLATTPLWEARFIYDRERVENYLQAQLDSLSPDQDRFRILMLGDSFTYGSGVEDKQLIFPELVESRLRATSLARFGAGVELFNAGIPGSLTNWWVNAYALLNGTESLEQVGDFAYLHGRFKPDLVVAVFFLRDGTLTGSIGAFFGPIYNEIVLVNDGSILYRYSYLYRYVKDALDRVKISEYYIAALNEAYFGDEQQTREWSRAKANLLRIKAMAERDGADMALVIFPVLIGLDENYKFQAIVNLLETFGKNNGISTLSLLDAYSQYSGPELWVSSHDQHPNEKGHAIAAKAIADYVETLMR